MAEQKSPGKVRAKTVRNSSVVVTRQFKQSGVVTGEEAESQIIAVHKFATVPAEAGASFGLTIKLVDFNFARVDYTVKVPCYIEELDRAMDFVETFVEKRLDKEMSRLDQRKQSKKPASDSDIGV